MAPLRRGGSARGGANPPLAGARGSDWPRMAPGGPVWPKWPQEAQIGTGWPQDAQIGPGRTLEAQIGPGLPLEAQIGPVWPYEAQIGTEWHQKASQDGPRKPKYATPGPRRRTAPKMRKGLCNIRHARPHASACLRSARAPGRSGPGRCLWGARHTPPQISARRGRTARPDGRRRRQPHRVLGGWGWRV